MNDLNWKSEGVRKRFQEAIYALTGKWPRDSYIHEWFDTDEIDLQEFCIEHARCNWMTGIGIIEAVQLLVQTAFENGNIDSEGNVK